MLKIVRVTGLPGSGKTNTMNLLYDAMQANCKKVALFSGEATAAGVAHTTRQYGLRTILIDECSERMLDDLCTTLADVDAYVIAVVVGQ